MSGDGAGPLVVGVISDTHGLLRPEAAAALAGVGHIIHAGDIGDPDIVPWLGRIAPVSAIRGNVDRAAWARAHPATMTLRLAGRRLHVLHDANDLALDPVTEGIDAVIAGHSHRPSVATADGVLRLNPGSAGPRRFSLPVTLATLRLGDRGVEALIHDLLPTDSGGG